MTEHSSVCRRRSPRPAPYMERVNPVYIAASDVPTVYSSEQSTYDNYETLPDILVNGCVSHLANRGPPVSKNPSGVTPSTGKTERLEMKTMRGNDIPDDVPDDVSDDADFAADTTWDSASHVTDVHPPSTVEPADQQIQNWLNIAP